MDTTEAIIIEIERNPILYDKADRDYKDIVKNEIYGKQLDKKSDWQVAYVIEINLFRSRCNLFQLPHHVSFLLSNILTMSLHNTNDKNVLEL